MKHLSLVIALMLGFASFSFAEEHAGKPAEGTTTEAPTATTEAAKPAKVVKVKKAKKAKKAVTPSTEEKAPSTEQTQEAPKQ